MVEAVERLSRLGRLVGVSNVYQNPAVGPDPQPDYLNAAALVETERTPDEVRRRLRRIERDLGRKRQADKFAARTIDLDISLFGALVADADPVHIPDPGILTHAYLAVPLAELSPHFKHPVTGQSLAEIANHLRGRASLRLRPDVSTQLQSLTKAHP